MKVKNIAFSGFMAAIMLSAGATAANAKIEIASRQYVDKIDKATTEKITNLTTTVEGKADKTTVNELQQNVTNLTTTIDGKADAADLDGYLKSADAETTYAKKDAVTGAENTANAAKEAADAAKNAADAAAATANANKTAIGDAESGLTKDVAAAAQAAADAAAAAAAADTKAGNAATAASAAQATADAAATKTELTDGLALKENTANKTGSITEANQSSASAFPTVGAITEWTNKKIAALSESGLPVNPDNISDNSIDGAKLANGAVTTEKIADGAVTEDKLSDDLKTKVNGAQTSDDVATAIADAIKNKADKSTTLGGYGITDAMTETEIKSYAVPKPSTDCIAESGRCVLSVDTSGNPYWMDVTAPLGE